MQIGQLVPPPTRGWPPAMRRRLNGAAGSPAHAGMAPARHIHFGETMGSPAHAGMAPRHCDFCSRPSRFPRPRGDGPRYLEPSVTRIAVPPPTRGWPPQSRRQRPPGAGSPAHAGMAPPRTATEDSSQVPPPTRGWPPLFRLSATTRHRFPRPRGDGPCVVPAAWYSRAVPPPTAKPNPLTF